MAVGGLPSKRQGRLGRPQGSSPPTRHGLLYLLCQLSLFIFTFFLLHLLLLFHPLLLPRLLPLLLLPRLLPRLPPSPSSPAPSPAPSPSPSPAPSPPPSPSPSPSPSPPAPSPTPSPSQSPFPLLVTTSCETSYRLRLFGATPRDQARYPPTRIRPCHSGLPPWPRHRPHPVFFKTNPERLEPQ